MAFLFRRNFLRITCSVTFYGTPVHITNNAREQLLSIFSLPTGTRCQHHKQEMMINSYVTIITIVDTSPTSPLASCPLPLSTSCPEIIIKGAVGNFSDPGHDIVVRWLN